MSTEPATREKPEGDWRRQSANDRFKDGWNARFGWSVVVAAALHAVAIGFWPTWQRPPLEPDDPLEELTPLELINLFERLPAAGGPGMVAAVPVSEVPDSVPVQADVRESEGGDDAELAAMAAALEDRLTLGSGLRPTVVEREALLETPTEDEEEEEGPPDQEGDEISGRASSTAELTELPEPSSLALDRLTALRPELALVSPTNWVLIRNPREVERFIRRSYLRGTLDRSEEGMVSVALWIDERGSVEWAEINRSSGLRNLDEVALELFSEVVAFRPARDEGVPVSRSVVFSVRFPW